MHKLLKKRLEEMDIKEITIKDFERLNNNVKASKYNGIIDKLRAGRGILVEGLTKSQVAALSKRIRDSKLRVKVKASYAKGWVAAIPI
jgi:hypothetical protein